MQAAFISIDLTIQEELAAHLLQRTSIIRQQIQKRRNQIQNKNAQSFTYQAIVPKISAYVIEGHIPLFDQKEYEQKIKKDPKSIQNKKGGNLECSGSVVLTISTRTLYPFTCNYAQINEKKQECYYIEVNGKPYTMIGVTYPAEIKSGNQLGDLLAILVSQQIRFNTIQIFIKFFTYPESYASKAILQMLFINFKDPIYNYWKSEWSETVKINDVHYQKKVIDVRTKNAVHPGVKQFQVLKMLKKI